MRLFQKRRREQTSWLQESVTFIKESKQITFSMTLKIKQHQFINVSFLTNVSHSLAVLPSSEQNDRQTAAARYPLLKQDFMQAAVHIF